MVKINETNKSALQLSTWKILIGKNKYKKYWTAVGQRDLQTTVLSRPTGRTTLFIKGVFDPCQFTNLAFTRLCKIKSQRNATLKYYNIKQKETLIRQCLIFFNFLILKKDYFSEYVVELKIA